MAKYCEVHPLYFPEEGPPKGFRLQCRECLRLYLEHMENQHEQLIVDTENLRESIEETGSDELKRQFDLLLTMLKGDRGV